MASACHVRPACQTQPKSTRLSLGVQQTSCFCCSPETAPKRWIWITKLSSTFETRTHSWLFASGLVNAMLCEPGTRYSPEEGLPGLKYRERLIRIYNWLKTPLTPSFFILSLYLKSLCAWYCSNVSSQWHEVGVNINVNSVHALFTSK